MLTKYLVFQERVELDGLLANPGAALVKKLVAVLESIEKLPVYIYDSPGSGYGLQVRNADLLHAL